MLAAVARLRREPGVAYAEPDYLMSASTTPNDPSFSLQWALSNTAQGVPTQNSAEELGPPETGTVGADDRVLAAWGVTTGSRSIVVGETDTGVAYNHPDLAANIWSNPGGIGGCAAGTHGYNVLASTCDPMDDDTIYGGHGTHVAGILGAVGDNGIGVAGTNWQSSILPVKWLNSQASGSTSGLISALQWLVAAKQAGVNIRVINDSATFYGTAYSQALSEEIDTLGANNILFVTAAGNTGDNNDEGAVRRYPCGYDRPNEICATATDNEDQLPSWANYGPHTVDLAAPGVSIYSTLRNGTYGYLSGGSMASPQVAGAAALILSAEPSLSAIALKADILENVDPLPSLAGKVITGGRLNVCKAMPGCALGIQPTVVTESASSVTQTSATLNGTVNPNGRTVSDCHFDYGTSESFGSSVPCSPLPGSGNSPVPVSAPLPHLDAKTTYLFRIVATSSGGTGASDDRSLTTLPGPPMVVTGVASSVTQTSATLNATVNPNGGTVEDCHFDYGSSPSYGSSVPCTSLPGSGESAVAVAAPAGGLSAGSNYYFRIVATNPGGTSYGAAQALATQSLAHEEPNPPTVATGAASSLMQSSAMLNATVEPNGSSVSDCRFDYGLSTSYGASAPCSELPGSGSGGVSVSAPVAGLATGANYYFRIVATNMGGTSYGVSQAFTTQPATAPLVPQGPGSQGALPGNATLHSQKRRTPSIHDAVLASTALAATSSGTVSVTISCPAQDGSCAGTVTLRTLNTVSTSAIGHQSTKRTTAVLIFASGSFMVAGGRMTTVKLRLSAKARALLARRNVLDARATIVSRDPTGATHTTDAAVTLRVLKARSHHRRG